MEFFAGMLAGAIVSLMAVAALGQLTNKANYSSTREHIVGLIKDIATF